MKAVPFLLLAAASLAFAAFPVLAVDLRADEPVPPVPPGSSLPAAANPTSSPSTKSGLTTAGGDLKQQGQGQRFEKFQQALELSQAQAQKIKPILERTERQAKALRSSVSLSTAQKKEQIRQLHAAAFARIRPILTPQQIQKWKQFREQHHAQTQTASS
jgi:hypothetical protein